MSAWHGVAVVAIVATVVMVAAWGVQLRTRNAGYVDVAWAALLACAALYYGATGSGDWVPRLVTALLAGTWGFRLALHLLHRVMREPEDGRYAYLREHWGGHQGKFLALYLAQAALVVVFSLPFFAAAQNPAGGFTAWTFAAIAIWLVAIVGEAVADRQLATFRADPANHGRTCRVGLWRYTRHPNYFFEWLHWFAYPALAVGAAELPITLAAPVVMYVMLNYVSGIPFVEAQALRSRGDDFRRYQRETNAFFPGLPKVAP